MTLKEIIVKRVSQAKFNQKDVDLEQLINLLDVAVYAPNHKMREPWRFVILEGHGKEKFVKQYVNQFEDSNRNEQLTLISKVFSAPVVLAVIMPKTGHLRDDLEDLQANAAMVENLLLLLAESDLSSFWKTPLYIASPIFRSVLGITPMEEITGLIMIGYSDQPISLKPRQCARSKTSIYS